MSSSSSLNPGTHGGASLCESCAIGAFIDDSHEEFYEDTRDDGKSILRHKREQRRESLRLSSVIEWVDVSPEYATMEGSAKAGCELCGLLRTALLRRKIDYHGQVEILCGYVWGGDRDRFSSNSQMGDSLVYLRCEVFGARNILACVLIYIGTKDNDISCWLRIDEARYKEPLDPENVEWKKSELWKCDKECGHTRIQTNFLPTRLIAAGDTSGSNPRLIVTADLVGTEIEYATLSYCWGPKEHANKQMITTRASLNLRREGIPFNAMTPVVKDAVSVCRVLQIRYLWIDALCIIQGDLEDWNRESEMMGQIYYHSCVTICPLSSHSCLQGFLGQRRSGVELDFQSTLHEDIRGTLTLFESYNDEDMSHTNEKPDRSMDIDTPYHVDTSLSSLITRGWTLSEEQFTQRILFCGKNMWHFACGNVAVSENRFVELDPGNVGEFRELVDMSQTQNPSEETNIRACEIWCMLNSTTYGRHFTDSRDLFPSIAGLAKAYAEVSKDTYLAGLWKGNIHIQLVWQIAIPPRGDLESTLEHLKLASPYIATTWSWASRRNYLESCIPERYDTQKIESSERKHFSVCESEPSHIHQELSLLDHDISLEGSNPYGRINNASLLLQGKLAPFPSDVTMQPSLPKRAPLGYFAHKVGTVMLDWSVAEKTVQKPQSMMLLLTASCCRATSDSQLRWYRNPEEDHTEGCVQPASVVDQEQISHEAGSTSAALTCSSCQRDFQQRNVWGLVLHLTPKLTEYYRVGAFVLFGDVNGIDVFQNYGSRYCSRLIRKSQLTARGEDTKDQVPKSNVREVAAGSVSRRLGCIYRKEILWRIHDSFLALGWVARALADCC